MATFAMIIYCFAISWRCAQQVGLLWEQTEKLGGWPRRVSRGVAFICAVGFSWSYGSLFASLFSLVTAMAPEARLSILDFGPAAVIVTSLAAPLAALTRKLINDQKQQSYIQRVSAPSQAAIKEPFFLTIKKDLKALFEQNEKKASQVNRLIEGVIFVAGVVALAGIVSTYLIILCASRTNSQLND